VIKAPKKFNPKIPIKNAKNKGALLFRIFFIKPLLLKFYLAQVVFLFNILKLAA
jgi:hypothetical protein